MRYLFSVAFFILAYNCLLAQNIRPKWVDDLGGTASCEVSGLAVDKQNNVYVTGDFEGTIDFDPSTGVRNLTSVGESDIFIGKYKQDGTLIWVKSIGGSSADVAYGIAVDNDENISIVGNFFSSTIDADPGPGVYILDKSNVNSSTPFIIHLDTNGNFLWASAFTDSGSEGTYRVATDKEDNVITTSSFYDTLKIGDSTYSSGAASAGLVVKYNSAGNVLWSICLRGRNSPYVDAWGVAVDSQDNVLISGTIDSTVNFNPLGNPYNLTAFHNNYSSYVAKYSPSGNLIWANGINDVSLNLFSQSAISVDQQDNVYFNNQFNGSISFGVPLF